MGVSSGVDVVGLRSKGCSEFCVGGWGDSGGIDPQSGGLGLLGVNLSERLGVRRILFLFFMLPQILCTNHCRQIRKAAQQFDSRQRQTPMRRIPCQLRSGMCRFITSATVEQRVRFAASAILMRCDEECRNILLLRLSVVDLCCCFQGFNSSRPILVCRAVRVVMRVISIA